MVGRENKRCFKEGDHKGWEKKKQVIRDVRE